MHTIFWMLDHGIFHIIYKICFSSQVEDSKRLCFTTTARPYYYSEKFPDSRTSSLVDVFLCSMFTHTHDVVCTEGHCGFRLLTTVVHGETDSNGNATVTLMLLPILPQLSSFPVTSISNLLLSLLLNTMT